VSTRIHVTQRDIDEGEPGSPESCPIARAIKRKLKTNNVRVGGYTATIEYERHHLPDEATNFIELFDDDRAEDVEPFVFVLG